MDTGFQGAKSLNPDLDCKMPKKKPKKRKLNGGEKLGNKLISKKRVLVENAIARFKAYKICSFIFRGITKSLNTPLLIVTGVINLQARVA